MKVPEMKVITNTTVCDSKLDEMGDFFDPNKYSNMPYHDSLLIMHFKNQIISNVVDIFGESARETIPKLELLEISSHAYTAIYNAWLPTNKSVGFMESRKYAHIASRILAESICNMLMSVYSISYVDSKREEVFNAILKAASNYFEI